MTKPKMKESELYIPVRDWLVKQGWTIYVEHFDADIIAMKDGVVRVVELKTGFTDKLYWQACQRAQWADEVMGAVPVAPKYSGRWTDEGFGLLIVTGGKVRQKHKPRPQPWQWRKKRKYRIKELLRRGPAMDHEVAGLPACPQLADQRERRKHSGDTI